MAEPVAYDFRQPIQLSREHARMLQMGLDAFARQASTVFTSSLRTVTEVALVSVDQRTYAEYVDSLSPLTYMLMFGTEPIAGTSVLEVPIAAAMETVDHMLGGPGGSDQPERPLTEIETTVLRILIDRLLKELRYSLEELVSFEPEVTGVEYSPQFAQAAAPGDVVVVATFDLRVEDGEHRFTLCLPFAGLLPHLLKASAPSPASPRERAQRAQTAALMARQFGEVPVEVAVRFRPSRLGPTELGHLRVGDVVKLQHPAAAPCDVAVGDALFAHATTGSHGRRLAALIVAAAPTKEH